jgi:predicted O-methyltransferase YrrM
MEYQHEGEFIRLLEVYKELSPRRSVLEIGSLMGETLKYWMENGDPGMQIISVDMLVSPLDSRYERQKYGHDVLWHQWALDDDANLIVINANSTHAGTVARVSSLLVNDLDFLFIDGGHDYQTVLSDYLNYGPLVRPGGVIAFHDIARNHPGSEVRKVWDKIISTTTYEHTQFILDPDEKEFGIGVLWV